MVDSGKHKDNRRDALPFHKVPFRSAPQAPATNAEAADGGFAVLANIKTPEESFRALRTYR